jgi:cold shock protein
MEYMGRGEWMTLGVVRGWDAAQGWGVVDSEETPGGCFVSFANIDGAGYRQLTVGQEVEFTYEEAEGGQDGYAYRALRCALPGGGEAQPTVETEQDSAYRSIRTITWDELDLKG